MKAQKFWQKYYPDISEEEAAQCDLRLLEFYILLKEWAEGD